MTVAARSIPVYRRWQDRVERARELELSVPSAAPVLRFYGKVLEFQTDLSRSFDCVFQPDVPVRDQLAKMVDRNVRPTFQTLLSSCFRSAPGGLAARARIMQDAGEQHWRDLLHSALDPNANLSEPEMFFARAIWQPLAESLQSQMAEAANYSQSACPACGGLPQLAILRPEGEGALRSLLCSFCLREWTFRRIVCPWCGEENKDKLPQYSADDCPHVRVGGCDSCQRYIKEVDMSVDGRANPLVDEVAWAALDLWAGEHGYTKIVPNLMGF